MRNILTIINYEYKAHIMRIATWGVFAAGVFFSLLDDFPSGGNLRRLEFLTDPVYFVYRTMSLGGLPVAFALMVLLSNRFSLDCKTGVKSLIMAGPTTKAQYIFGKTWGGFFYTVTVLSLFLAVNVLVYCLAAPFQVSVGSLLPAIAKTIIICVLPVSVFISFLSVSLPGWIDVRLFYAMAAVLFIINASTTGSAEPMPFYCITSGDLTKLIWRHPKFPLVNAGSIQANLVFLTGGGLLSLLPLLAKRRFWRHE